jgi:hypothetical protein
VGPAVGRTARSYPDPRGEMETLPRCAVLEQLCSYSEPAACCCRRTGLFCHITDLQAAVGTYDATAASRR